MENNIKIVEYTEHLAKHFTKLNLAWVKKYFTVEPKDEEVLGYPKEHIIDKGGYIFFAKMGGEVVGTFALIKMDDGVFELSKMAVAEEHHGKKIGNKMLEFCLEKAKELKANKVILFSNTVLQPAIHLYKKYGFKQVPLNHSEYKRSNIKMETDLNEVS